MLIYSSAEARRKYGRVVELVDSLDSGSSVHCGRAGSSPASPTKKTDSFGCPFSFFLRDRRMTSGEMSADGLRWCADCAIILCEGMRFGRDIEPSPVLQAT